MLFDPSRLFSLYSDPIMPRPRTAIEELIARVDAERRAAKFAMALVFAGIGLLIFLCWPAKAQDHMHAVQQEHQHGGDIPDWYDPACCSQRDCKPVDDNDVEFGQDPVTGTGWVRYKPTGNVFYQYQFRRSQDERFHVCINPAASGNNGSLCFYDRAGV